MNKKLLDILPNLQTFKDNVITPLNTMFNGAEWLNDATTYTKQETIYRLLILKYGDRYIRYDNDNIFINRLVFDLADLLPDIYAKQQVFIKNKLNEFLSDNKNRAVIINNETTNNRDSNSNSKIGNSSSPLNLVIDSAEQIQQAPITSSNLSNVKLVENYNGNNQQVNYNFVNDLVKTLNADYSLRLNEFMELLAKHFVNVVGSYYKPKQCNTQTVKDEPYRFNNGYLVNEVDYLGSTNKQEIDRFNAKLENLNNQVATKQNQLIAGDNITIENNVISASGGGNVDLSNYYNKQQIDTQQDTQNKLIEKNKQDIQDIYRELVSINGVNTELNDKVNANTNNIETNYQKLQELEKKINNNIINFYKGQLLFFDTKSEFDEFNTQFNFVVNVDYEVLESDRYLLIGDNGGLGGSNIINENNIQQKQWRFFVKSLYVRSYGNNIPFFQDNRNTTISSSEFNSNYDISTVGGATGKNWTIDWSYGSNSPQEFLPKYKEVFAIKFLKNV